MLDGDHLIAANPPPPDEVGYVHAILALLIDHHRRFGYLHFVITHFWRTSAELDDLRGRLCEVDAEVDIRCFLLVLSLDDNLRRIQRRQSARALDEQEFEQRTVMQERGILSKAGDDHPGDPFDASASPEELVETLLSRLGIR